MNPLPKTLLSYTRYSKSLKSRDNKWKTFYSLNSSELYMNFQIKNIYLSWGNQALLNCPCFSSAMIWNFISLKFKHVFKWQWCSNSHESQNYTVGYFRRMEQGTFLFGLHMTPSINGGHLIWKYASELLAQMGWQSVGLLDTDTKQTTHITKEERVSK